MKCVLSLVCLVSLLACASSSRADIVYTFASAAFHGTLGTEQDYTAGGYTIKTYGFDSTLSSGATPTLTLGKATDLFAKYTANYPSETGLGIANVSDDEISSTNTVKVDMTKILSANPNSPVILTIGSVQHGEGYAIFGGSSSPSSYLGSFDNPHTSPTQFTFTITAAEARASGDVFYITAIKPNGVASDPNVLLNTIDVASTPEPASVTLALVGLGCAGGFGWLRRRRQALA